MYSRGKQLLEEEKNKPAEKEDKTVSKVEALVSEFEKRKGVPLNQLTLIDGEFMAALTDLLVAVAEERYSGEDKKALLKATENLEGKVNEMYEVLALIWKRMMTLGQKEEQALDMVLAELRG